VMVPLVHTLLRLTRAEHTIHAREDRRLRRGRHGSQLVLLTTFA
jgi:hypothetical protein